MEYFTMPGLALHHGGRRSLCSRTRHWQSRHIPNLLHSWQKPSRIVGLPATLCNLATGTLSELAENFELAGITCSSPAEAAQLIDHQALKPCDSKPSQANYNPTQSCRLVTYSLKRPIA